MIVGGRYELIEVAGRGGMADVWRGRVRGDSGFVRDVAVKQMHQNLASQPTYVAMFVEEARVAYSQCVELSKTSKVGTRCSGALRSLPHTPHPAAAPDAAPVTGATDANVRGGDAPGRKETPSSG